MRIDRRCCVSLVMSAALAPVLGCNQEAEKAGTGAEEAAVAFFEAVRAKDWSRAYASLHPESKTRCNANQFAALATAYHHNLAFTWETVRVRSCEEHGNEAL